jgi:peptidoglycan/xylan/chitin deacetylase (PgdA/CDA1 family)
LIPSLTIVMYHYVRDGSPVHARTVAELEAQLDFVAQSHEVLRVKDVAAGDWPADACLLTFDDGLREHLDVVAPALEARGLTGCFCPPAQPVLERRVLDVQKTQWLLGMLSNHAALGDELLDLAGIADEAAFRAANTPPHRFDPPETVFVKRALQDGLPEDRRREVLDRLFRAHVSDDERGFADELYLTLDECRELVQRGHDVIGHGYEHRRLGLLDEPAQREEIDRSRAFADEVGGTWALCYAYGSRNETTLRLLEESSCAVAFTTEPRRATANDPLLELPRIDTNDLERERLAHAHPAGGADGRAGEARTS